ncbi:MAG: hypothetical protein V1929_00325 [bacterium]
MIIDRIQQDIADFIKADAFFKNIDIVTADKGTIDDDVGQALAKLGLCVVVEMMTGKVDHENVGAGAITMRPTLSVIETPLLNRTADGTGKRAEDVVEQLFLLFSPLRAGPGVAMGWEIINDTGGRLAYQVELKCNAGWEKKTT